MKDPEEKNKVSRPLAISIVAACSFLMGLIGTLAGGLLGLFLLQPPIVSTVFVQNGTFLALLWLVIGPILIYSSYHLFRMKKWAAWTVATVILFDLFASPLFLVISQSGIGATDVLAWSVDVIMLLLLASAWHTAFNQ